MESIVGSEVGSHLIFFFHSDFGGAIVGTEGLGHTAIFTLLIFILSFQFGEVFSGFESLFEFLNFLKHKS